jgi:hypothetical protein
MKRPIWMLLGLLAGLNASPLKAAKCDNCDCIHLPCPKECKPCCGLSEGVIVSNTTNGLTLSNKEQSGEFKITSETEIDGNIASGRRATVYYKASKQGKVAQKVVVSGADNLVNK